MLNSVALLLFATTRDVIKGERACNQAAIAVEIVPVPRHLSTQCGMALEVQFDLAQQAKQCITAAGIAVKMHEER